jgi:two-component system cell cycle sensor histidine kinase/response regulator CckA
MRSQPGCILVAEDDPILRLVVVRTLSKLGYSLLQASDGMDALQLSEQHREEIDLLITNVHMPRMEGHELARLIKKSRPAIRILIISGDDERDFPPEAHHHCYALMKPVSAELLTSTVRQMLTANVEFARYSGTAADGLA